MINLIIPKTDTYLSLKEEVLSSNFAWHYVHTPFPIPDWGIPEEDIEKYNCSPYFSHAVLKPPKSSSGEGNLFSLVSSSVSIKCNSFIQEIAKYNNVNINLVVRINFNLTLPSLNNKPDKPHYDHEFPHKNMVIYFTDFDGGETVIFDEFDISQKKFSPSEDTGIIFEGKHCFYYPTKGRRVVMVVTFI